MHPEVEAAIAGAVITGLFTLIVTLLPGWLKSCKKKRAKREEPKEAESVGRADVAIPPEQRRRRRRMIIVIVLTASGLGGALSGTVSYLVPKPTCALAIRTPTPSTTLSSRFSVEGTSTSSCRDPWLVVHPVVSGGFWVLSQGSRASDGAWTAQGVLEREGLDYGQEFELRAVSDPRIALRAGALLPAWPDTKASSDTVRVRVEPPCEIVITKPAAKSDVDERFVVEGTSTRTCKNILIVTHRSDSDDFVVHAKATLGDGTWRAQLALTGQQDATRKELELLAISNLKPELKLGTKLDIWPQAPAKSGKLELFLMPLPIYDFEGGSMGWLCQREGDTQACQDPPGAESSTEQARVRQHSLKMPVLLSSTRPNSCKGEVWVDILQDPPPGVSAPLDLSKGTISAYVYAPAGARGDPAAPNGFQLFVKDQAWHGAYGPWTMPVEGGWRKLSFSASSITWKADGFDPVHVRAIGVKFACNEKARSVNFSGAVYIDAVTW